MKLPPSWALPESIKSRFGQKGTGKQRAMVAEGHLVLVLHQVPQVGERHRDAVLFWRKPDGSWQHSGGGIGLQPLLKHLQAYSVAEVSFSEAYEQAKRAEDYFNILEGMSPLRLATKNLQATLQAAREGIPGDRDLIDLRDWAYDIERTLDLLYENTKNALDYDIAKRAEEQTQLGMASLESSHRLNILAAIFYPLTAISCLFGMNVASGFGSESLVLFWAIALSTLGLGIFVRQWVVKGRWL